MLPEKPRVTFRQPGGWPRHIGIGGNYFPLADDEVDAIVEGLEAMQERHAAAMLADPDKVGRHERRRKVAKSICVFLRAGFIAENPGPRADWRQSEIRRLTSKPASRVTLRIRPREQPTTATPATDV